MSILPQFLFYTLQLIHLCLQIFFKDISRISRKPAGYQGYQPGLKDITWVLVGYQGSQTNIKDFDIIRISRILAGYQLDMRDISRISAGYQPDIGDISRITAGYQGYQLNNSRILRISRISAGYSGYQLDIKSISRLMYTGYHKLLAPRKQPITSDEINLNQTVDK